MDGRIVNMENKNFANLILYELAYYMLNENTIPLYNNKFDFRTRPHYLDPPDESPNAYTLMEANQIYNNEYFIALEVLNEYAKIYNLDHLLADWISKVNANDMIKFEYNNTSYSLSVDVCIKFRLRINILFKVLFSVLMALPHYVLIEVLPLCKHSSPAVLYSIVSVLTNKIYRQKYRGKDVSVRTREAMIALRQKPEGVYNNILPHLHRLAYILHFRVHNEPRVDRFEFIKRFPLLGSNLDQIYAVTSSSPEIFLHKSRGNEIKCFRLGKQIIVFDVQTLVDEDGNNISLENTTWAFRLEAISKLWPHFLVPELTKLSYLDVIHKNYTSSDDCTTYIKSGTSGFGAIYISDGLLHRGSKGIRRNRIHDASYSEENLCTDVVFSTQEEIRQRFNEPAFFELEIETSILKQHVVFRTTSGVDEQVFDQHNFLTNLVSNFENETENNLIPTKIQNSDAISDLFGDDDEEDDDMMIKNNVNINENKKINSLFDEDEEEEEEEAEEEDNEDYDTKLSETDTSNPTVDKKTDWESDKNDNIKKTDYESDKNDNINSSTDIDNNSIKIKNIIDLEIKRNNGPSPIINNNECKLENKISGFSTLKLENKISGFSAFNLENKIIDSKNTSSQLISHLSNKRRLSNQMDHKIKVLRIR